MNSFNIDLSDKELSTFVERDKRKIILHFRYNEGIDQVDKIIILPIESALILKEELEEWT